MKLRYGLCLALVLGLALGRPLVALAGEHGGKEHAGEEEGKEHAGKELKAEEKAVYNEAADALGAENPALANQLRAWAKGEAKGSREEVLTEAVNTLQASNPDLAAKLEALMEA